MKVLRHSQRWTKLHNSPWKWTLISFLYNICILTTLCKISGMIVIYFYIRSKQQRFKQRSNEKKPYLFARTNLFISQSIIKCVVITANINSSKDWSISLYSYSVSRKIWKSEGFASKNYRSHQYTHILSKLTMIKKAIISIVGYIS